MDNLVLLVLAIALIIYFVRKDCKTDCMKPRLGSFLYGTLRETDGFSNPLLSNNLSSIKFASHQNQQNEEKSANLNDMESYIVNNHPYDDEKNTLVRESEGMLPAPNMNNDVYAGWHNNNNFWSGYDYDAMTKKDFIVDMKMKEMGMSKNEIPVRGKPMTANQGIVTSSAQQLMQESSV